MLRYIKNFGILAGVTLFLLTGCYKDKTVIIDTAPEVTRTVTFSADILPIFAKNCSLSGCHVSGSQVPDLSATNAYNSLTVGNYYDKTTPANSKLYMKMSGKLGNPMPLSGSNLDNNAFVLAW